jgi:hypothetical protein
MDMAIPILTHALRWHRTIDNLFHFLLISATVSDFKIMSFLKFSPKFLFSKIKQIALHFKVVVNHTREIFMFSNTHF